MNRRKLTRVGVGAVIVLAFVSPLSATWKEKVLHSFQGGSEGRVGPRRWRGV